MNEIAYTTSKVQASNKPIVRNTYRFTKSFKHSLKSLGKCLSYFDSKTEEKEGKKEMVYAAVLIFHLPEDEVNKHKTFITKI